MDELGGGRLHARQFITQANGAKKLKSNVRAERQRSRWVWHLNTEAKDNQPLNMKSIFLLTCPSSELYNSKGVWNLSPPRSFTQCSKTCLSASWILLHKKRVNTQNGKKSRSRWRRVYRNSFLFGVIYDGWRSVKVSPRCLCGNVERTWILVLQRSDLRPSPLLTFPSSELKMSSNP